ncbi:ATP-binding protein, partial [Methanobrevibacter gottschalkii]|uniref:ATP-binding protein n=2 Tax=Methanobacteriaceae TaxID=2159 RepID=UPI0034E948DD
PLEQATPDTTLSSDEREIGGLGILLIKKNVDVIEYERVDNKNILTIHKILN